MSDMYTWLNIMENGARVPFKEGEAVQLSKRCGGGVGQFAGFSPERGTCTINIKGAPQEFQLDDIEAAIDPSASYYKGNSEEQRYGEVDGGQHYLPDKPELQPGQMVRINNIYGQGNGEGYGVFVAYALDGQSAICNVDSENKTIPIEFVEAAPEESDDCFSDTGNDGALSPMSFGDEMRINVEDGKEDVTMEDLEKWMQVIENDGVDVEDDAEELDEAKDKDCDCGSYDCSVCFPDDKDVSEEIIDENEIFDIVYELAEEDEFEDDLDEAYDDDEEIEEMRMNDIEEGILSNSGPTKYVWKVTEPDRAFGHEVLATDRQDAIRQARGYGIKRPSIVKLGTEEDLMKSRGFGAGGRKKSTEEGLGEEGMGDKRAQRRASGTYGKKKGVREEGGLNVKLRPESGGPGGNSIVHLNINGKDVAFWVNEFDPMKPGFDWSTQSQVSIDDLKAKYGDFELPHMESMYEEEPEEFDTGDSSAEFAGGDDEMVDIGDAPDMDGSDPMAGMDREMGTAEVGDPSADVSDLIAKIAYVQDMGMSMTDRFYDPDKLSMMKPEMIQRIHSKVVGESASGGGMGAGGMAMESADEDDDELEESGKPWEKDDDDSEEVDEAVDDEDEEAVEEGCDDMKEEDDEDLDESWYNKFLSTLEENKDEEDDEEEITEEDDEDKSDEKTKVDESVGANRKKKVSEAADPDIVKAMKALFE